MNSLSWLIYLASVLPNVAGVCVFLSIFGIGAYVAWLIVVSCHNDSLSETKWEYPSLKNLFWFLPLILLATLLPDKETIYLIAASEASEAVVTSEYGKELLVDIQEVIEGQLNNLKKVE